MRSVCQGITRLSRFVLATLVAASAVFAGQTAEKPVPQQLPHLETVPWPDAPFPELVLHSPPLASALLATPGWRGLAEPPWPVPAPHELATQLGALFAGVSPLSTSPLAVVVGAGEGVTPAATVVGGVAVVRWPLTPAPSATDLARLLTPPLLSAGRAPAAPDPGCSEPLLGLAEALLAAGHLALVSLPPALRPVREWLEPRDATAALGAFSSQVLDVKVPWRVREAHLARAARGAASPEVGNAAAVLVEAFGDAEKARRQPCEVLRAWRAARGEPYPPLPGVLRRALDEGPRAGIPATGRGELDPQREAKEVARAALQRLLERGELPASPLSADTPFRQRALAAANARARGAAVVCALLGESLPAGLRTGCREEGETGGWVYVRPGEQFEIVARAPGGEEAVLLRWPRWALFPVVGGVGRDLYFVDQEGIQLVDLSGAAPPALHWGGNFRALVRRPGADGLAVVVWPSGEVMVEIDGQRRALGVKGRGGVAWVDRDLLVAADEDVLQLVSLTGQARRLPAPAACLRSLAVTSGTLLAAQSSPCEPALVRIDLLEASSETVLRLAFAPFGLLPLPDGSIVLGGAEGLYRWGGAGNAERIGVGLTPGPG